VCNKSVNPTTCMFSQIIGPYQVLDIHRPECEVAAGGQDRGFPEGPVMSHWYATPLGVVPLLLTGTVAYDIQDSHFLRTRSLKTRPHP
jgi:hypothetical protein